MADVSGIQAHVANRLDPALGARDRVAGIIGDRPSQYAKSPSLWNAVFKALGLDAGYLAFDVDAPKLGDVVRALRKTDRLLGGNVTVPYKVAIIEHLDGLDDKARRIGAVNTIVRTPDGKLIGYNTDGSGFLWSLTAPLLDNESPLLPTPKGVDSLVIGAGGAARAVAFYLAEAIGGARLTIANRDRARADALAAEVRAVSPNTHSVAETEVGSALRDVGLVVNCSTKGQAGLRKLPGGQATILEPYSALTPAAPPVLPEPPADNAAGFYRRWFEQALTDIERNNASSARAALGLRDGAVAYDIVYAPLETVFMRHCRLAGHRVANGKGMNIAQAVDALVEKVCRGYLKDLGRDDEATRARVIRTMCEVW